MTIKIAYVREDAPDVVGSVDFNFNEQKSFDTDATLTLIEKKDDAPAVSIKAHICNYTIIKD